MYEDTHYSIFLLGKDCKQPKCSSVGDWLDKHDTLHITEHSTAFRE